MRRLCKVILFALVMSVHAFISYAGNAKYVRADGRELFIGDSPFVVKGAALMDDATLWNKRKTDPSMFSIEERDYAFTAIGEVNTVRLVVKGDYFLRSDGSLKMSGFSFLDRQIAFAKKYGLYVIIDMHVPVGGAIQDYKSTPENQAFWDDANAQKLFVDGWKTIAKRYRNEPAILGYELLNEPSCEPDEYWDLMAKTVAAIRSVNKNHLIILQASRDWKIRPFLDKNSLYSYHFYDPIYFTHQNVIFDSRFVATKLIKYPGMARGHDGKKVMFDRNALRRSIFYIRDVSKKNNVPIVIGEFGVSTAADETSISNWISDVVSLVSEAGLCGYIYWRQIEAGTNDLHDRRFASMAIINRGSYFSPAQFFGIRPEFAAKNHGFDAAKFYWHFTPDMWDGVKR